MDILNGERRELFLTDHKGIGIKDKTKSQLDRSVILLPVKFLTSFYFLQ